jgi:hypothetical protein
MSIITLAKTYKAKSSAKRAAIKINSKAAFEAGSIELNAAGQFYFKPAVKKQAPTLGQVTNKSTVDSPCAMVWEIAGKMEGSRRKDIIAACEKAGIAFYTARTQYQKYREAMRESEATIALANAK